MKIRADIRIVLRTFATWPENLYTGYCAPVNVMRTSSRWSAL